MTHSCIFIDISPSGSCELCEGDCPDEQRWVRHELALDQFRITQIFHHSCLQRQIDQNNSCSICQRSITNLKHSGSGGF